LIKKLKIIIQKLISLIGYQFVKNKNFRKLYRTLDDSLIQLVLNPEPLIFDVGAHEGETIRRYRKIFKNSTIHSFEPQSKSFEKLKKYRNIKTFTNNFALGSSNISKEIYTNKDDSTSSFYKFSENLNENQLVNNKTEKVEIKTLDEYVKENQIDQIDILKIDVQGYEKEVLLGANSTLKDKVKILELEIIFIDYYQEKSSFYDLENIIKPLGFELYTISSPVLENKNYRLKWIDALYVSKKFF